MSIWSTLAARVRAAEFATFGEPITYIPEQGLGDPITTVAILRRPTVDPASRDFFADIEVDPTVVTPQVKDEVVWADSTAYVVRRVQRPPDGLLILSLHRKDNK